MIRSAGLIIAAIALVAIAFFVAAFFLRRRRLLCAVVLIPAVFLAMVAIDEWVYLRWSEEMESLMNRMSKSVSSLPARGIDVIADLPRLDAVAVHSQTDFGLVFEPPRLAWTYYLWKTHAGRPIIESFYDFVFRIFSPGLEEYDLREIMTTHTVWYISVMRCETIHACERGQSPDTWIIYSDHGHGM